MATTLDSLSAADKADFLKRMAVFGLDGSSVLQPDLIIPPKTTMTLSSTSANSFLRPHLLTTSSLDELKSWIGIPDQHFQKGLLPNVLEAPIAMRNMPAPTLATPASLIAPVTTAGAVHAAGSHVLASKDLDNIRTAAVSFIWGNSAASTEFKSTIEATFKNIQVAVWPFLTITVSAGSVLEIGAGPHVLCAWKIIIQQGGQVRGVGTNLNVQCTILQKQQLVRSPVGVLTNTVELPN